MASSRDRGTWASKGGFVLAAAGSAVGLGNIWRFPTQVGKAAAPCSCWCIWRASFLSAFRS